MLFRIKKLVMFTLAGLSMAHATTVFSGTGTSGTTQGQTWSVDNDNGLVNGEDDWGLPGVADAMETWTNGPATMISFTLFLPNGVTIDPTTFGSGCCSGMMDISTGDTWTPTLSANNLTVTFTAPGTDVISPGDQFFLNVFFTSAYSPSDPIATGDLSFIGYAEASEPEEILLTASGLLITLPLARRARRTGRIC